jgi:hypothetical protein
LEPSNEERKGLIFLNVKLWFVLNASTYSDLSAQSAQVGGHVISSADISEIMSQAVGWERTFVYTLKSDAGVSIIGQDKLPSELTIKMRIIGSASSGGGSPGPSSMGSRASSVSAALPRRRVGWDLLALLVI